MPVSSKNWRNLRRTTDYKKTVTTAESKRVRPVGGAIEAQVAFNCCIPVRSCLPVYHVTRIHEKYKRSRTQHQCVRAAVHVIHTCDLEKKQDKKGKCIGYVFSSHNYSKHHFCD